MLRSVPLESLLAGISIRWCPGKLSRHGFPAVFLVFQAEKNLLHHISIAGLQPPVMDSVIAILVFEIKRIWPWGPSALPGIAPPDGDG